MNYKNTPLFILDELKYGIVDKMERTLICKLNALDLVLMENSNELFRLFMQEEENEYGTNLEHLMHLICSQYPNAVYLPTDTFDIQEDKNGSWKMKKSKLNGKTLKAYLDNSYKKMVDAKISSKSKSVIFTIIGLNLGEGGHYGAIVCDVATKKVVVFDSMSGQYENNYYNSGTEQLFLTIARKIFNYPKTKKLIGGKLTFEPAVIDYILQPTGGFEDIISPSLTKYDLNEKLQRIINIQHTDSQNHFCYIWSIWFCHIYLSGGMELFRSVITDMYSEDILPIVTIKKYILGFTHLLGKIDNSKFFYYHFPRIWSNHLSPKSMDFKIYKFSHKLANTIDSALNYSIDISKYEKIKTIKHTKSDQVKTYLECFSFDNELRKIEKNLGNIRISENRSSKSAENAEIIDISV